jgi:hypothetical protein
MNVRNGTAVMPATKLIQSKFTPGMSRVRNTTRPPISPTSRSIFAAFFLPMSFAMWRRPNFRDTSKAIAEPSVRPAMQYTVPSTGPQASPAAMKIGTFGIGAKSTESAMTSMKTTTPKAPRSSTHSLKGSASI